MFSTLYCDSENKKEQDRIPGKGEQAEKKEADTNPTIPVTGNCQGA